MAVPARPTSGVPIETAWGQVAHDTAVAQDIQGGSFTATIPTSGTRVDTTVTFPRPFAAAPAVTAMALAGAVHIASGVGVASTTSVVIGIFRRDGGVLAGGTVTVYWQAVGPRA